MTAFFTQARAWAQSNPHGSQRLTRDYDDHHLEFAQLTVVCDELSVSRNLEVAVVRTTILTVHELVRPFSPDEWRAIALRFLYGKSRGLDIASDFQDWCARMVRHGRIAPSIHQSPTRAT